MYGIGQKAEFPNIYLIDGLHFCMLSKNISSLPNGMYIIRIFSDGEVWTEKLMVQR